ncbi:MAG: hydrogenase maturation protein [Epsilonproteobacteria bacterium]|nr:MAG: hydrogenase maturation protein [Campylobacterota bacterium]RLA66345.1 MAG: hydrogenase maturation protein [Campylobacterota bacterium]
MKILILCHSFNSLSQRVFVELKKDHQVSVELDINESITESAVNIFNPDVIIAPFLKRKISASIWRNYPTLIVHPGIPGDKGPSSLDWAILNEEKVWGVTILSANGEYDGGEIWDFEIFDLPKNIRKSSLYRKQVTDAAIRCLKTTLLAIAKGEKPISPEEIKGQYHPPMKQINRAINWEKDSTNTIIKKLNASDSRPGVLDTINDIPVYLFHGIKEQKLKGKTKEILATRNGAICLGTTDAAIWITHLKKKGKLTLKLPATDVIPLTKESTSTYQEIYYEQVQDVGYLYFNFYNGAMSTDQCQRLLEVYKKALTYPTKVLVLMGGSDFWSNGIHLHKIENAASPAEESWQNINAMNDLVEAIIGTTDRLTVSAMRGNAGAGGVFMALATDYVWAYKGIILNPHYKSMGNLFGSEYWTYLLPRRIGKLRAKEITDRKLPMGSSEALHLGLIDKIFEAEEEIKSFAFNLSLDEFYGKKLHYKDQGLTQDQLKKPLKQYRVEELDKMRLNFFGFDPSYHVARYNFTYNVPHSRTPKHLAVHRGLNYKGSL